MYKCLNQNLSSGAQWQDQRQWEQQRKQEIPSEHKERLFHWKGERAMSQVAKKGSALSILGGFSVVGFTQTDKCRTSKKRWQALS